MNYFAQLNTPAPTATPTALPTATSVPFFVAPSQNELGDFIMRLFISLLIVFVLYVLVFYGLRLLFRSTDKEIALVTLNISQVPVLIILGTLALKMSFDTFDTYSRAILFDGIKKALTAVIVAVTSYWIAQLFTQVIAYYLKKYAQQSEAMWDDVLIPILESTVPLVIYLFGAFLFLQSFGIDLTGLWVAFGGITFVLGFALQDILANFFGGLVLLVDTPFQFGDVIQMPDGSLALIKKIGIRLTNLFIIDTHCELFVPNGSLQKQNIINLSRPSPHYYYSIQIPLRGDIKSTKSMKLIKEVVLAHPDTLGDVEEKIRFLDVYYNFGEDAEEVEFGGHRRAKKENARQRLLADRNTNNQIQQIKQAIESMVQKIQFMEKGGLDTDESKKIQGYWLEITKMTGLEVVRERQGSRRLSRLEEAPDLENTLIGLVRTWYKAWSKDPDLTKEDPIFLKEEWERKIFLLKLRMNRIYEKLSQPSLDEKRLDDYALNLITWLDEKFKNIDTVWQEPKIWSTSVTPGNMGMADVDYTVKYYIDNIKLEQCQRGNRIKSEVQAELLRQLRNVYIYR